eukprot:1120687-Amphidinium_carterae.1
MQRNMRAYYLNFSSNRWLAIRLESLGTAIVTSSGLLAVMAKDTISAGQSGIDTESTKPPNPFPHTIEEARSTRRCPRTLIHSPSIAPKVSLIT